MPPDRTFSAHKVLPKDVNRAVELERLREIIATCRDFSGSHRISNLKPDAARRDDQEGVSQLLELGVFETPKPPEGQVAERIKVSCFAVLDEYRDVLLRPVVGPEMWKEALEEWSEPSSDDEPYAGYVSFIDHVNSCWQYPSAYRL